ncbi:MAG: nuclear transport factor 2 family protein [Pyrinomonadaceae bacterium]|nr:nuclear transport factor 2 family protein [Pyrinomonadaceae bacterium]
MKKFVLLLVVTFAAVTAVWLPTLAQDQEEAAVRRAIDHYFQGHATGDGEHYKKVFHPESNLFWIREGQFAQRTSAEYIAGASGKPAPDEPQRKRRIESVDITGNAAVVKLTLDYPQVKFTDYMSMLKIDGEWKIVNKLFHAQPKARS